MLIGLVPKFVHLGLVLNEDGKKMSKRDKAESLRKVIKTKIVEVRLEAKAKNEDENEAEAKFTTKLVDVCNTPKPQKKHLTWEELLAMGRFS